MKMFMKNNVIGDVITVKERKEKEKWKLEVKWERRSLMRDGKI